MATTRLQERIPSARRLWHAGKHVEAIARGYRYGRSLEGQPPGTVTEHVPGRLERHFDANTEGPGIWKWRHYFDIYERHFARFVGQDVSVVEVGIYSGGSLSMWADYFGDRATIHGVDIEPACRVYSGGQVEVHIGDQADRAFWAAFRERVPTVDIVIDDGGHLPHQQMVTLEEVVPHIRRGGVYLCEDVAGGLNQFHAYVDALGRHLNAEPRGFHQHIASVHRYPNVVVIEKAERPVETFDYARRGTEWEPFL